MSLCLMLLVFLIDYYLINKRKLKHMTNKSKSKKTKGPKKEKSIGELDYLISRFKLNKRKLNKEKAIIWISLINSFIISFVSCIVMLLPLKMIWQLLIAFVLLFALIYSLYEIYGRHLKKMEERK